MADLIATVIAVYCILAAFALPALYVHTRLQGPPRALQSPNPKHTRLPKNGRHRA